MFTKETSIFDVLSIVGKTRKTEQDPPCSNPTPAASGKVIKKGIPGEARE
ncbi:hypothetical protein A2U01_0046180 [Trifolium medium]|uniref:Uncharacterized protein n=1 Tax=Trifolium medium TaxID=97028 RepID=A0A392QMB0_9FABA|nr:hypothetical protein [Trifolium medium]